MHARYRIAAAMLALFAALFLSIPASAAPGIALAWDHCLSEGTGVQNKVFACDTNVGGQTMVGTFQLAAAMDGVKGTEIVVQVASASPVLPAWWHFSNVGTCRQTALSVNGVHDLEDLTCPDWSGGGMGLAFVGYCGPSVGGNCQSGAGANGARILIVTAVHPSLAASLESGQEYFAFNLLLRNLQTVGTGACAGCETPVCIVFNSIKVEINSFDFQFLSTASSPGGNFVTWQGGGGSNCPAATPTRGATWGSVKSLYR